MQSLSDAATLAILILLALTVRVSLDGEPLVVDIGPAAEAGQALAMEDATEPADFAPVFSEPCDAPPPGEVEPSTSPSIPAEPEPCIESCRARLSC